MTKAHLIKLFLIVGVGVIYNNWANATQGKHLLVFGDSLSAAYGIDVEQGWAHLLNEYWLENGVAHHTTNASISGETTDGGLARLELTLNELKPDVVMLQLGANDGLRGHPLSRIRNNLQHMIDMIKQSGAEPIVVGISLPPNHGPRYIDGFRQIFRDVAAEHEVPYIDFYREEFFSIPGYIQQDGLHPTALPQPLIVDSLLDFFAENSLFD
ncbi:MAG: arylesterase [Arenicella sp.]|nr:arylesterase [Arenicella sp.]